MDCPVSIPFHRPELLLCLAGVVGILALKHQKSSLVCGVVCSWALHWLEWKFKGLIALVLFISFGIFDCRAKGSASFLPLIAIMSLLTPRFPSH